MSKESGNKTLFIRNIPYSVTKTSLEEHFSEYGPLKNCFIVSDKGKSRGFGYVQFTVREDAIKAKEAKNVLEGRNLAVDYADIKRKKKSENRKKNPKDADKRDDEEEDEDQETSDKNVEEDEPVVKLEIDNKPDYDKKDKSSQLKYHKAKIVLVSGLPPTVTDTEVNSCLQKLNVKQVAETKIVQNGKVHVKFKCIRDAKKAIRKLNNQSYKETILQASQLSRDQESVPPSAAKRSRVIVRNLAFRCTETDLQNAFLKCGTITEVKLPTNKDGKSLGFGFVQFTTIQEAQKAIKDLNLQKIAGRPVAVDWALPKDKYETKQKALGGGDSDGSEDEEKPVIKIKEEPLSDDDDEEDGDEEDQEEEEMEVEGDESAEESSADEAASSEESDSDVNDDEEEEDDDDEMDESDDSEEDDDEGNTKSKKSAKRKGQGRTDVDAGCTLFIRNLSFDSDEAEVQAYFERFGEVHYARVVIDRNTEHSRGMAFVKFKEKSSAEECLSQAAAKSITLDGRELILALAVSREQSTQLNEKTEKVKKDNRNLHLAREGLIRPGTAAAEGLSKADLDRRTKVEEVKRQKLKNVDIFISPLRLSVRNIPINVDEKELRNVFKSAAKQGAAKVTECRIMRDRARQNSAGVGKSQGFGFISFTEHQHALTALRHLNNNPDIFGKDKRLIVEFSLENRKALEVQAKRKERFLAKRDQLKQQASEGQNGQTVQAGQRRASRPGQQTSKNPMLYMKEEDRKSKGPKLGPKGLPSHLGPKIRHKPRPSQLANKNKKSKKQDFKQQQPMKQPQKRTLEHTEGPAMKKSRRGNKQTSDSFDTLVNSYRNKFMQKRPDKKWFNA